jgi:hypothetical protein
MGSCVKGTTTNPPEEVNYQPMIYADSSASVAGMTNLLVLKALLEGFFSDGHRREGSAHWSADNPTSQVKPNLGTKPRRWNFINIWDPTGTVEDDAAR